MKIQLKSLHLLNFKGTRDRKITFGANTIITGDNETGKTTLFDAFTWLLFGKDSSDRKDFNVKTLDKDNQPIHKLEHSVEGIFDVDGVEHLFRRVLREKWVKQKGAAQTTFTGHETAYFYMDVPMAEKEYKGKVDGILNENIAKLLTNPLYFNSIKWTDRRNVLIEIAGEVTDEFIAGENEEYKKLLAQLNNKTIADLKKEVGAKRKRIQDELTMIPTRIDEAEKSKPEPEDFKKVEKEIEEVQQHIDRVDKSIESASAAGQEAYRQIADKQQEKHNLLTKVQTQKNKELQEYGQAASDIKNRLRDLASQNTADNNLIEAKRREADRWNTSIINLKKDNATLRSSWEVENEKEFKLDDSKLICPTCERKLEPGKVEEITNRLKGNFDKEKAATLNTIEQTGINNKIELERLDALIVDLNNEIVGLRVTIADRMKEIEQLAKQQENMEGKVFVDSPELKAAQKAYDEFIVPEPVAADNSQLKAFKKEYTDQMEGLKQRLFKKTAIEKANARIAQLMKEEETMAQQIAELERTEYQIDSFNKSKISAIEERVNSLFSMVRFKMFEQQINQGEIECCECLVNGVPFSDVNTAGQVNAGLDIINTLCKHYNVYAPVWIDNRESVIRILACDSQIVNLIAKEGAPLTASVAA